jgi:hypothetical protein
MNEEFEVHYANKGNDYLRVPIPQSEFRNPQSNESRVRFALTFAVLQTAAWIARLTGCLNGQEAGIRTRTVRFTGEDAAVTPQS